MRRGIWTKLKGLLGLGGIGAGLGAVVGATWMAITGFLGGTLALNPVLNGAIVYGSFGFFTATGLGLFLASARSKASLEDVSVAWSALIGAAAGAVFPLMFNILMLQSLVPLRLIGGFLPIMGTLGLFGGALTAGMVAAAKNEQRLELRGASENQLLREPSKDESLHAN